MAADQEQVTEVLKRARAVIEDPDHWCAGAFARDALGRPVSPQLEGAVQWCARGATFRVLALTEEAINSETAMAVRERLMVAAKDVGGCYITTVNDQGHEKAMKMFDLAINDE
jgi:hypothetical protein